MNTCLVATDGSDHALCALDIAMTLAPASDCELIVIHVISDREPPASVRYGVEQEFRKELINRSASFLSTYGTLGQMPDAGLLMSHHTEMSQMVNTICGEHVLHHAENHLRKSGYETASTLLLQGDPADQLIKEAVERQADMVVMGCRGLGGFKGLLFGSVSQRVAHELECRVIMVK